MPLFFYTVRLMRRHSILVVVVIALSVTSTGSPFQPFGETGIASIQTLDVCHSSLVAANSDLPYLSARACTPYPLQETGVCKPFRISVILPLLVFQNERPPKSL
jgi:hypothetical protein